MENNEEEKFVAAIMKNDNIQAIKKLDQILQKKCAKKIDKVLKKIEST